jgi:pyruvate/2-oxoglutarate dehydrogenase complex dihydrolipoamide dehydrogenase (E3) component
VTILSSGIAINDEQHRPYLSFSTDGYTAQESDDIYFCGDVAIHGLYTTAHNAVLEGRRIGKLVADRIK